MQEDQRDDREWQHWPGRKPTDDRIRHRLKALFSSTEGDTALEALIEEKGREIEEHTDQLQSTINDLERREARTTQLRTAVEEMLRHGSAELDERHADLTKLALDLAVREENVRAQERDIAVRKQEFGAVELRRAAVERREVSLTAREAALEEVATALDERERRIEEETQDTPSNLVPLTTATDPGAATFDGNVLLLPDEGYRMLDRAGRAEPVGAVLEVGGSTYVVTRIGRSPLPGDRRRFAYLERHSAPSSSS